MSAKEAQGIWVTPARVGFALSLLALLTAGWKGISHVTAQDFMLQAHETYIQEDKAQTKEILEELKRLNNNVTRLLVIVEGDQRR